MTTKDYREKSPLLIFLSYFKNHKKLFAIDVSCAVGIAAIYRAVDEINGHPVRSIYSVKDIPDYASYDYKECPYCKKGRRLDALVNSHGYSWL